MLDAASKAFAQMFTPPFRRVLLKSIALAFVVLVVIAIGLQRVLSRFAEGGGLWAESMLGPQAQAPATVLVWVLAVAAGLGVIAGALFLMPAVTALVGSFFVDEIAGEVERTHYPAEPPGRALPLSLALWEGIKTAFLAVLVYLCALPFVLFAGFGFLIMFVAVAYLLSREYFLLAAMRCRTPEDAKAMRRSHRGRVFAAGLPIALLVSIPILNFTTSLFAMAMMVHVHKRLSGGRIELIEPSRVTSR
jgi:uncharacterized protein involved in cysteine biosynthesis